MTSSQQSIVIVGAGIVGLNTALVLAERGFGKSITVVAEYLPGDTSATYTSPWAGCNFSAISGTDANALRWDRLGYAHLAKLASMSGGEAFVKRTPSIEYWDEVVPRDKIEFMSGYLEDFQILPSTSLPAGVSFGISFTTFTLHAPKHCEYLRQRLKTQYGVHFIRRRLPSIAAAFLDPALTKLVFNCVGLAAQTLPGVQDPKCYPTRGQVVLVRAPQVATNIMRHGRDYETYVIPRPRSAGHVVLGGFMQKGDGDTSTYASDTASILRRTTALSTELAQTEPEILTAAAGLRPSREGGARVERENVSVPVNGHGHARTLVHNYGAGGTGFQAGYGMATDAVACVEDILFEVARGGRARL
ncbi:hypothetical protein BJY00DRAFT_311986 [Aspergillus carlsbadensis]|nr:hypothetical protein BJY00DRAFT_311986 [Aspergillus carlsbadensis]